MLCPCVCLYIAFGGSYLNASNDAAAILAVLCPAFLSYSISSCGNNAFFFTFLTLPSGCLFCLFILYATH